MLSNWSSTNCIQTPESRLSCPRTLMRPSHWNWNPSQLHWRETSRWRWWAPGTGPKKWFQHSNVLHFSYILWPFSRPWTKCTTWFSQPILSLSKIECVFSIMKTPQRVQTKYWSKMKQTKTATGPTDPWITFCRSNATNIYESMLSDSVIRRRGWRPKVCPVSATKADTWNCRKKLPSAAFTWEFQHGSLPKKEPDVS